MFIDVLMNKGEEEYSGQHPCVTENEPEGDVYGVDYPKHQLPLRIMIL